MPKFDEPYRPLKLTPYTVSFFEAEGDEEQAPQPDPMGEPVNQNQQPQQGAQQPQTGGGDTTGAGLDAMDTGEDLGGDTLASTDDEGLGDMDMGFGEEEPEPSEEEKEMEKEQEFELNSETASALTDIADQVSESTSAYQQEVLQAALSYFGTKEHTSDKRKDILQNVPEVISTMLDNAKKTGLFDRDMILFMAVARSSQEIFDSLKHAKKASKKSKVSLEDEDELEESMLFRKRERYIPMAERRRMQQQSRSHQQRPAIVRESVQKRQEQPQQNQKPGSMKEYFHQLEESLNKRSLDKYDTDFQVPELSAFENQVIEEAGSMQSLQESGLNIEVLPEEEKGSLKESVSKDWADTLDKRL